MSVSEYLQTQPLLRVSATLLMGIVIGNEFVSLVSHPPLLLPWLWISVTMAFVVASIVLKDKPYSQSVFLFIAILFAGIYMVDDAKRETSFPFCHSGPIAYEAVVASEPQIRGKTLSCDLAIMAIEGKQLGKAINVKAHILRDTITNDWRKIQLCSGIVAQSVMSPLKNYHDGNFNYERWLRCHGFRATTFIFNTDWQISQVSLKPLGIIGRMRLKVLDIRRKLICALMLDDNDSQHSAIVSAMVLGDRQALSHDTKEAFSVSGASHVLALSGLHLSIIYFILSFLLGQHNKHIAFSQGGIIISLWFYVLLVGMTPSIVRSAVMLSIYSICRVGGRDHVSINALSLAAICLMVANPMCVYDVGFQMSFMAVLAILALYRPICGIVPNNGECTNIKVVNSAVKAIWSMTSVSLAAQVGTAPLVAYYFGRISCYFLLTNLIVVPLAAIIIYCAIGVIITSFIPSVSQILLHCLGWSSSVLATAVNHIASLPGASVDGIKINAMETGCIYVLIVIACTLIYYISKLKSLSKLDAFHNQ